ncbi:MAG: pantoate--beta-alanine ligase [Acidimicrobiia bacterium]|nr:pantoate--beta-alanine ligase [Acidimicrobiia bacterium]
MTRIVRTFEEVRAARAGVVGLVPTLGYLHEGHLALMNRARDECDLVVVTIFVNPLQFDDPADLERYPSDIDRDLHLIETTGAGLVFVPSQEEMYPVEPLTRVEVKGLDAAMEGAHRPGHFAGVATVVAKFLAGLQPDRAYFGQKDAQQLAIITRMVTDLSIPVVVVPCPTVREADGLALSSRNMRLDSHERVLARRISGGLMAAADAAAAGERSAQLLGGVVRQALGDLEPEYVTLADRSTAAPIEQLDRPAFLAVAQRVGSTRLIDNVFLEQDGRSDRGVRMASPSILYGVK